jgi:hypothetical protein
VVAAGAAAADGLDRASYRLPAPFFSLYDNHGGKGVRAGAAKGGARPELRQTVEQDACDLIAFLFSF